jgi:hypothetical protein
MHAVLDLRHLDLVLAGLRAAPGALSGKGISRQELATLRRGPGQPRPKIR